MFTRRLVFEGKVVFIYFNLIVKKFDGTVALRFFKINLLEYSCYTMLCF